MKNSFIKATLFSVLFVFGLTTAQAQNPSYQGKTLIIENTKTDIVKADDGSTRTMSFFLGEFESQSDLDNLVNNMLGYPGVNDFTVSGVAADGRRSGTLTVDQTLNHRGVIKYLTAAGIEYIWVDDLKSPIQEYYMKRAAAKQNK